MRKQQRYSRGDSFKYFAANRNKLVQCRQVRQGDEYYCSACGIRWPVDEDRPNCGKSRS